MQNKANFKKAEMNVSSIFTKDYENERLRRLREKQSQTKPISKLKTEYRKQKTEGYLPEAGLAFCHKSSVSSLIPDPVTAEMA